MQQITPEMRVLLICHAEDMHDRYDHLGNENSGLTARGWEQADLLATWLQTHEAVDGLVSDVLLQCRLTAQRLGQALGMPVTVQRDLPACATPSVNSSAPPQNGMRGLASGLKITGPEVSPSEQELVGALDRLIEQHWGTTLALVTCPGNITALLRYLVGGQQVYVRIDPTGLSELCFTEGRWRMSYMNRTPHLPSPVVVPRAPRQEVAPPPEEVEDLSGIIRVYRRVASSDLERKRLEDQPRVRGFLNFLKLPPDQRILDVGTGNGLLPLMLAETGASVVVGIDISPEMLEQAEFLRLSQPGAASERVSFRLAPIQSLPFRDESFDTVTCRLVLNHSTKPARLIREMVRVLRPGGTLVLAELLSADNPVKRATQNAIEERRNPSHAAARGAEQYDKLVTDAGLSIEAREVVALERELDEWLAAYATDKADAAIVREMIEAGLETDAAGIHARRQGATLVFEQRMYYLKATKPAAQP
jgi:ubiquinone/menaquinone biosynthesis C-methylase UbiE/broad specificity phosphatase PhoE